MAHGLVVSDLVLAYPGGQGVQPALDVPFLQVPAGGQVGITGPSGSGKSSLLNLLAGLERPQRGRVRWGDIDVTGLSEAARDRWRRRQVGMIFQEFHLVAGMTAEQNVLLAATFDHWMVPGTLRDRARMLLTRVGVPGGLQRVETLSRGEMQRVAVARALLYAPPVLLADEPTASLDMDSGARVMDLLGDLADETGSTLVIVTHDPQFLARLPVVHTLVAGRLAASRANGGRPC